MGNCRETLFQPKELLLRGLVERYADSGLTGRRGRKKKQISGGTNLNFEPIILLGGKGTGGVAQTKTTFGVRRSTLPEGARLYGSGIFKGEERNLRGVPVII